MPLAPGFEKGVSMIKMGEEIGIGLEVSGVAGVVTRGGAAARVVPRQGVAGPAARRLPSWHGFARARSNTAMPPQQTKWAVNGARSATRHGSSLLPENC